MELAPIPLPESISGSEATPKFQQLVQNMIMSQGAQLSRPACEIVSTQNGSPRGQFEWDGDYYAIFGQTLYKNTDLSEEIGTVLGSGAVSIAKGFTAIAIATGAENYSFNGMLSVITDIDLPQCRDVTRVDGRYVWTPSDGSRLIYSDINDLGQIDSLAFFDAESLPDKNILTVNTENILVVCGAESIEAFRNIGSDANPFIRIQNSIISVGYVGGVVETKDSFLFLGQDKEGGYKFFTYTNGQAVVVSSDTINEQLNLNYTREELESVVGQRFNWRGVDCYVFSMPDLDYIFTLEGEPTWGFISSGIDIRRDIRKWGYQNAFFYINDWFLQASDGLYRLTEAHEDSKGAFARFIQTFMRIDTERYFRVKHLELKLSQQLAGTTVALSLSKDGRLWSPYFYAPTGTQYDQRLVFRPLGGLGQYQGYMGITLYSTDPVAYDIENMVVFWE